MFPDLVSPPRLGAPSTGEPMLDRFAGAWASLDCPGSWRRLLVAVSGGPDSLALLHLLHATRASHRLELEVAHADHGIHPESAAVARRVAEAAERLGLPVVIGRLALGAGASETAAREARHAWLESARRSSDADAIALAHHRDDQVETVLLRVLAGSGPAGLAGMLPRHGRLVRPLLGFDRAELAAWLESRGVEAWVDPANADPRHDRSWVRTVLLPLLTERDGAAGERLLRLSAQAATERRGWDAALAEIPGLDPRVEERRISLDAIALLRLDRGLGTALLRAAARRVGCVLGPRRTAAVLGLLRRGISGRRAELGGGWQAELAFGRLELSRASAVPLPLSITGDAGEAGFGEWRVTWQTGRAPERVKRDAWTSWFIGGEVAVRAPVPGDRLRPLGGTGHRAVARMLQAARVPRGRRGNWPLVEVGGQLAWVAGVCRGTEALAAGGAQALRIEVTHG